MTPFEISILLHYHTRPGDFRDGDFSAPLVEPTLERFADMGLLHRNDGGGQRYSITDGGYLFVNTICAVPAPVRQWVIPEACHD